MLTISSAPFVVAAMALVVAMRALPRRLAAACYAVASLALYAWALPDSTSMLVAAVFVYGPWPLLRWLRLKPALATGLVIWQTALFIWAKKYLGVLGLLVDNPLVSHAVVLVGAAYVVLRQVEMVLWLDTEPDERVGWVEYTNFAVGLFTLLAGPIIPFRKFRKGFLSQPTAPTRRDQAQALNRIVNGYLKVGLVSPILSQLTTLQSLEAMDRSLAGWAVFFYLYPLYIYVNFAGYCDVVIGLGRLANFTIPENFDRPFLATNIQNYWQRWHITFSTWIRNHLFFPLVRLLRGSPTGFWPNVGLAVAAVLTFLLVGLWHGTDPGFAIFGILHGLAVMLVGPYGRWLDANLSQGARATYESPPVRALRVLVCYNYLCFTMIFFERPFQDILGPLL